MTLCFDHNSLSDGLSGNSLYGGLAGTSLYESYQRGVDAGRRTFGLADVANRAVPRGIFDQAHIFEQASKSYSDRVVPGHVFDQASRLDALMRHPAVEYASKLDTLMNHPAVKYASKYPSNMIMGRPLSDYVTADGGLGKPSSVIVGKLDVLIAEAYEPKLCSAIATPAYEPKPCSVIATPADCKVDIKIRCALCRGPVITVSSTASWVGRRRLKFNVDVVPICVPCTQRDQLEPNYLRDALRALGGEPEPEQSGQPELRVLDGDETSPVPCGRLRLVPPTSSPDLKPQD
jgi:hypothetical protein